MLYLTFDSWRKMLPKTANSLAWDFEAQSESCNELGWLQRKAHFHPQCISIIVHVYIHIHTIPYLYPYYPYLNLYWFELWKLAQAGVGYSAVVQQFVEQIKQYTEQWEERMKRDATVLPLSNLSLSPWLFKDTCWNPKKNSIWYWNILQASTKRGCLAATDVCSEQRREQQLRPEARLGAGEEVRVSYRWGRNFENDIAEIGKMLGVEKGQIWKASWESVRHGNTRKSGAHRIMHWANYE